MPDGRPAATAESEQRRLELGDLERSLGLDLDLERRSLTVSELDAPSAPGLGTTLRTVATGPARLLAYGADAAGDPDVMTFLEEDRAARDLTGRRSAASLPGPLSPGMAPDAADLTPTQRAIDEFWERDARRQSGRVAREATRRGTTSPEQDLSAGSQEPGAPEPRDDAGMAELPPDLANWAEEHGGDRLAVATARFISETRKVDVVLEPGTYTGGPRIDPTTGQAFMTVPNPGFRSRTAVGSAYLSGSGGAGEPGASDVQADAVDSVGPLLRAVSPQVERSTRSRTSRFSTHNPFSLPGHARATGDVDLGGPG